MRSPGRVQLAVATAVVALVGVLAIPNLLARPAPIADTTSGPRVRLTVTEACPRSLRQLFDVRLTGPADALVPSRLPDAAEICVYADHEGRVLKRRVVGPVAAAGLARAARHDPLIRSGGGSGTVHCPGDDGAADVIALGYRGARTVDLWYDTSGCGELDNGRVLASPDFRFTQAVERLVGPRPLPGPGT